jgi:hypothetical protein
MVRDIYGSIEKAAPGEDKPQQVALACRTLQLHGQLNSLLF